MAASSFSADDLKVRAGSSKAIAYTRCFTPCNIRSGSLESCSFHAHPSTRRSMHHPIRVVAFSLTHFPCTAIMFVCVHVLRLEHLIRFSAIILHPESLSLCSILPWACIQVSSWCWNFRAIPSQIPTTHSQINDLTCPLTTGVYLSIYFFLFFSGGGRHDEPGALLLFEYRKHTNVCGELDHLGSQRWNHWPGCVRRHCNRYARSCLYRDKRRETSSARVSRRFSLERIIIITIRTYAESSPVPLRYIRNIHIMGAMQCVV